MKYFNYSLALAITFITLICSPVRAFWEQDQYQNWKTRLFVSGDLGYNFLQKGYPGYQNGLFLGTDLYIKLPMSSEDTWGSKWKENLIYRVSFQYFPLTVPEGVYNTTEDLFSFSADLLVRVYDVGTVNLFAGLGLGMYIDWIRLDTPGTGKRSSQYYYWGLKPSIGARIKYNEDIEIIPEIRANFVNTMNAYFATNTSINIGIVKRIK
jgi:hypothetical protein